MVPVVKHPDNRSNVLYNDSTCEVLVVVTAAIESGDGDLPTAVASVCEEEMRREQNSEVREFDRGFTCE